MGQKGHQSLSSVPKREPEQAMRNNVEAISKRRESNERYGRGRQDTTLRPAALERHGSAA